MAINYCECGSFNSVFKHRDPSLVLSPFEFRTEVSIDYIKCKSFSDNALSEAENVSVIVYSRESCAEGIRTASGSDSIVFICCHAHSDTCSANEDTEICFTVLKSFANLSGKHGIITAVGRICSHVYNSEAFIGKVCTYLFFEEISCVVGSRTSRPKDAT